MPIKYLIVAGAGCTRSDAMQKPARQQPPLDRRFFKNCTKARYAELDIVKNYLRETYDYDPDEQERDSLEAVMAILYTDIHNSQLEPKAVEAFRALILLFNRRIAETTNPLKATSRFKLYRILCNALDEGIHPNNICIITFNQDIQIEKILQHIQKTGRVRRHGRIFNFPYLYQIPEALAHLSRPRKTVSKFDLGNPNEPGIQVLKLHGSLNWYSIHKSRAVPKGSILDSSRSFHITPRSEIMPDMTFTTKRKMYTFPLIIPPVTHKAGILHDIIRPLWDKAEVALKSAERITIFGYSCPQMDFESANLIRRTIRQSKNLTEFKVIDPEPLVFQRYADLTQLGKISYFRNVLKYLSS